MKFFLHVGCGRKSKNQTTKGFNTDSWIECRFDVDASVEPEIIGSMTNMVTIETETIDAIYSSHNIEHLYPHEVILALGEFVRVLRPDGFLVITCPDLQSVCAVVAEDKMVETLYTSPAGPVTALDVLYGYRPQLALGNLYMAHRCGFTQRVLTGTLQAGGFRSIAATKRGHPFYDIWAVASKMDLSEADIRVLAAEHFPS